MVCGNFILPEPASYVFFYAVFNLRNLLYIIMQAGVDSLADAGFRCNVCIVENGGSLLIYVLYDG